MQALQVERSQSTPVIADDEPAAGEPTGLDRPVRRVPEFDHSAQLVRLYASLADLRAAALAHLRDDAIRTGLLMEQVDSRLYAVIRRVECVIQDFVDTVRCERREQPAQADLFMEVR
ncbi:MAG TPA: hypothetical protein VF188_01370 [Longimicrobiales bacterium]